MNPLFCIFALTLSRLSLMQSALFTQRRQEKRVCFYCYLHLSLDCHIFTFINTETGISLLLLCNLALCLPTADAAADYTSKTSLAALSEMSQVVRSMQDQVGKKQKAESLVNAHKNVPELRLYTPEQVSRDCFETAFNCFIEELKVLYREFSFDSFKFTNHERLDRDAKGLSKFTRPENCTRCEEFEEKNVTDFLKAFEVLLQHMYKGL
ncbi:interleukin-15-like [Mustelus asterias]